jgi:hypothetical protein
MPHNFSFQNDINTNFFSGIGESGDLFPACAPSDMSNLRFWDALNGEAWFINATQYGHGDLYIEVISDDIIGVIIFVLNNKF